MDASQPDPPGDDSRAAGDDTPAGSDASAAPAARRDRTRLPALLWVVVAVTYVLDQVTKILAVQHLTDRAPIPVIGELIELRLLYNPGAALSIGNSMTWVLTLVATAVVVVIVRASRQLGSRAWTIALALLLGGALGNLTDRFLRDPGFARGHVVDFIGYGNLFVGNVADIAIVVAAAFIAVLALRGVGVDGTRSRT